MLKLLQLLRCFRDPSMGLLLAYACFSLPAQAALFDKEQPDLLPADQAFALTAEINERGNIHANWFIAEGYYLYKHQFKFTALTEGVQLGIPLIPDGEAKTDAAFGEVEVFYHGIDIEVPVLKAPAGEFEVEIRNQGCADIGLCYPPQKKVLSFTSASESLAPTANSSADTQANQTTNGNSADNSNQLAQLLNQSPAWAILVFAGLGILLSFNPCSYPMFPILSRIIVGQGSNITRGKAVRLSLAYVIPMAVMYAVAGAIIAMAGQNLFAAFQSPLWLGAVVIILLLLSLSMFGFYELQLPASVQTQLNSISERQRSGSYLGAAFMGAISALVVGACVLPPLTAALLFISQSGNVALGAAAMFVFGLGMGIPLVALGFSAGWLLPKAGAWMERIKQFFGLLLVAAAIYIASRLLAEHITLGLWGVLLMGTGLWLGALRGGQKGKALLAQLVGIVCLLWGSAAVFGALQGNTELSQPLGQQGNGSQQTTQSLQWQQAKTAEQLQHLINAHRFTMVDTYADWCIPCKVMEKHVFANAEVQQALRPYTTVKLDVTKDDAEDKALKAAFNIINPPTVMFFADGKEIPGSRITGEINREQFLQHLQAINLAQFQ